MSEPSTCSRCGRPVPPDAVADLCPACVLQAALNLPPTPPRPGPSPRRQFRRKRLLHYYLLEKIGEGGMGVVYKARDTRLDRIVAIKILPADKVDDPERRRRFIHEAKAASALNHPNIVTIHEVAVHGGVYFIVMEYVDGRTLDKSIGRLGLPPDRVLLYAIPVAGALAQAHEVGIVHRDLKPQNIMVRDDGLVKLLDFGLAKLTENGPTVEAGSEAVPEPVTDATRIMGTPDFMAPEQIAGRKVDGRADLFAFGAVLYHALSGRKPFARPTADETFAAIIKQEPAPLKSVSAPLAAIVERCLKKNPNDRFQTAAELQAALRRLSVAPISECLEPSIAVLPFANLDGRPEHDYIGEALSGEIITALARIPGLKVVGRTSSRLVAAEHLEPRAIGERLGVAHLLEGSVRQTETALHVAVNLIRAADGHCLWAESYDRTPADVFVIQEGIAQAIVARLATRSQSRASRTGQPTDNLEAYHHYLLGRHAFDRFDLTAAREQLAKAVRLDPDFAAAYDALSEVWWTLGFRGMVPPRDAIAQGIWPALRALEIDDQLADTHALLAQYRVVADFNWPEAHREFQRARGLDPGSPNVRFRYGLAWLLIHGQLEEACTEFEAVLQTDPLLVHVRSWLANALQMRRQHEAAIEQCRLIMKQEPGFPFSYQVMGISLAFLGQPSEAMAALRTFAEVSHRSPHSLGLWGWICGREGRRDEARKILTELETRAGAGYVPPSSSAFVFLGLGEFDPAIKWIDRAIEVRDPLVFALKVSLHYDPLRGHPRYAQLLRKMNMEP